jgi:hypothetical protein
MNRKIAALVLGAVFVLAGACSSDEPPAATSDDPGTTLDMNLVDVPVSKPPANAKVEKAQLPPELADNFGEVTGLTPEQQTCVNGAIKQAVEKDPTLAGTPGKRYSLGGAALAVCDSGSVFTDQLLEGVAGEGSETKPTPQQTQCLKDAFKADQASTGKLISGAMTMNAAVIQQALAPFEQKCGIDISKGLTGG